MSATHRTRNTPGAVLPQLLLIGSDLERDDDIDYGPHLVDLAERLPEAANLPGARGCNPSAWFVFHTALVHLNEAPDTQRYEWLAVMAAIRGLVVRDLEMIERRLREAFSDGDLLVRRQ